MANPQRMCVICRKSTDKKELFRFTAGEEGFTFDDKQVIQKRGIYICQNLSCIEKLSKHKKYKVSMKDLAEVAQRAKKKESKLLNTLKIMKHSGFLTFGLEMVEENIKKVKYVIIAKDSNKKNAEKLLKLCNENKIEYIITASKRELGEVFSKEEINVIGITDRKAAQGLLN